MADINDEIINAERAARLAILQEIAGVLGEKKACGSARC
jgi:hypothetical protein